MVPLQAVFVLFSYRQGITSGVKYIFDNIVYVYAVNVAEVQHRSKSLCFFTAFRKRAEKLVFVAHTEHFQFFFACGYYLRIYTVQ